MQPPLDVVRDAILYGTGPVWHHEPDPEALVASLAEFMRSDRAWSETYAPQSTVRALWLLDRLAPDDPDAFCELASLQPDSRGRPTRVGRGFRLEPLLVYAWGRRLRGERRHHLLGLDCRSSSILDQAVQAAWRDSCRAGEVDELLRWGELMDERAAPWGVSGFGHLIEPAAIKRRASGPGLGQQLLERARQALVRSTQPGRCQSGWDSVCLTNLSHLVQRAAARLPAPERPLPDPEQHEAALDWLFHTLRTAGHGELADLCREACMPCRTYGAMVGMAGRFWVNRHGPDDWEALRYRVQEIEEHYPFAIIRWAGSAIPRGRIDAWERILDLPYRGNSAFAAFCEWLSAEHRDILPTDFEHEKEDRAACAFAAYLHKAPSEVLREPRWQRRLSGWQQAEVDRYLHAPPSVGPGPVVLSSYSVEADPARLDALRERGY